MKTEYLKNKISKKQWILICACIAAGYLASYVPGRITITKTNSVKYHFFWSLKADSAKIQTGDYIRFTKSFDQPWFDCNPCSIVKRVGCVAGRRLEKREGGYYCDDQHIGRQNGPLKNKAFEFNGAVPAQHLFVVGDNEQSYDSRHFGFIKTEDIDARLIPLF